MMRKKINVSMLALGVVAGVALSSCSNQNEPTVGKSGDMLVKSPKMLAYSGNHTWSNTSGTRGSDTEANLWYDIWECPVNVEDDLTAEDIQNIINLFKNKENVVNDILIDYENYWVQQIYKGEDHYVPNDNKGNATNGDILGSDEMLHLNAWNGNLEQEVWWPTHEILHGGYEHIDNFNNGNNENVAGTCNCGKSHNYTTLMTGMSAEGCTPQTQFGYDESWGTDPKFFNNYIIVEYKGKYYVGFDYEAHKQRDTMNDGEQMQIERDWDFTDWIVRITPAYHKGEAPEVTDPDPDPEQPDVPKCDNCDHAAHEGDCPDCKEGDPCYPDDHSSETPLPNPGDGDDVTDNVFDEVEINLGLDDKGDDLLESHLSIHVRTATDVEVFIPVPAQYYCDADDMAIVMDHVENFVHGGPTSAEYNINGNIVTLNVEFVDGGIRIWTDGINQDVIDYCWENYHDGITFEVWNYFNDPDKLAELGITGISRDDLKYLLNKATVKFLDKTPGEYINSFGTGNEKYDENNYKDGNDFHVTPENTDEFNGPRDGEHLNGSENNEIWTKK